MKTSLKNFFPLTTLINVLGLMLAGRLTAQPLTVLHSFTAYDPNTYSNSDGAFPYAALTLSGNAIYGTAEDGGSFGYGTVFTVNTDGTGFTILHNFTLGSDGAQPEAGLILSGNMLYGTASGGGDFNGDGTVFAVSTNGTGFTTLHIFTGSFANGDGSSPYAGLILSSNTLYGTTAGGGSFFNGTLFAVNTNGTGFTTLHSFTKTSSFIPFEGPYTNSDGANPKGGLILSGNALYGTASVGGNAANGTVFKVNTDGTGFTILHTFTALSGSLSNTDGAVPYGDLILSGRTLYGTASVGGSFGYGTVFQLNTNGTGFSTLYDFSGGSNGSVPYDGLILSGNSLYGTTWSGGSLGNGTLFEVNTDGTGFTTLHTLRVGDGADSFASLILLGNNLYGTASAGGSHGAGTVFRLSLQVLPRLTIVRSGTNAILTWPTNATGFTLKSTTDLGPTAVWTTNSPAPVVVNGQNTVTNPFSGTRKFYRLSQ
jgi:uncharacterized repeat protein (TIGR03803 family)